MSEPSKNLRFALLLGGLAIAIYVGYVALRLLGRGP